ncbi:hypothetical protein B2D07_11865 [Desulfococcus multivorans]|uniref:Ribosome-associated protein n=1 Tax=Desulfococcus multivorans DSM 2059 TaxID=1121405 RepID=S7VDZ5_DESML|nr:ribosome biogenesis factor YjgA [Desulfococcus multivorans]AQV01382.1 hypothetical protein B2D07_11865 [Desulfococcus multivorans]EPR44959.1 putative protein family UPF0307 [Desulfococcus multivorans DSM 2059]SJZ84398.1 ribosome-associated protein [Desulfococcus multivorans DSM 2059]
MVGRVTDNTPLENGDRFLHKETPPSKSRRKREMIELQNLGERLVALSRQQIDRLSLPPELREAVIFAGTLTRHGARRRQIQRIGALMREVDSDPIREGLDRLDQRCYDEILRFKNAESWRERLLAEGDAAVTAMATAFPAMDRRRVRQLLRNAQTTGRPAVRTRASKQLFRYIIGLLTEAPEPLS